MVKAPLEYAWSSYRYFVGRDKKPKWLTTEFILGDFGGEGGRGYKKYRDYVERGDSKELDNPLKKVIASTFLGGKDFIERIRVEYLEKKEIDRRDLPALRRGHPLFRKICIYLSYQRSGLKLREIGEYFGMQRSAISQLSRRFGKTIKGNQELRKVLSNIEKEDLLIVAA